MRSNELRIGNIIGDYLLNEIIVTIDVLKTIDDHTSPLGQDGVYKPMPLTEERLLKFGFNKISHYTVTNAFVKSIGRNRSLTLGCVGTPNEALYIQYIEGHDVHDLVCLHNFDYDGVMYVHQLQNLYHALTGNELTLI